MSHLKHGLLNEIAVFSCQGNGCTSEVRPPGSSVRKALETIEEPSELDSCPSGGEALNSQTNLDRVLTFTESFGLLEHTRRARYAGDPDHTPSITRRISEAPPRRIEEDPLPRLERLRLTSSALAKGRALARNYPSQRLTVCNREEIIGHPRTFSQ